MRHRTLMILGLVGALLLVGCGDDEPAEEETTAAPETEAAETEPTEPEPAEEETTPAATPASAEPAEMEIIATDDGEGGGYAFEVPASVPAGATRVDLNNTGAEPHHAQLFKLNPDATMEDFQSTLAESEGDPTALLQVGTFTGGTGVADPGTTSSADAIVDLSEGTYAVMCFIEGPQGPHVAQGMLASFDVTAAEDAPALPEPDGEIQLLDYGFELPDTLEAGTNLSVTNASQAEPHELAIVRPDEGTSVDEIVAIVTGESTPPPGPPPFSGVGGVQAILPGSSQQLALDLEPGRYVFFCGIPSVVPDNEGAPHAALGMVTEVEVS